MSTTDVLKNYFLNIDNIDMNKDNLIKVDVIDSNDTDSNYTDSSGEIHEIKYSFKNLAYSIKEKQEHKLKKNKINKMIFN